MNKFVKYALLSGVSALLLTPTCPVSAQEPPQGDNQQQRRNFDPAQMRERMLERYQKQLEITDDSEWKAIKERVEKVMTLQMQSRMGGMGMMGMRRNGGPGGPGGGPDSASATSGTRAQGSRGGEANAELEALQKALDAKAAKEEVKDKLEKVRAARKVKEAELEKAQEDLKQLLTSRQEAQAVLLGLLK
jgi:hypothetical protein